MLYFLLGVVAGVFIPVQYNTLIKDSLFAVWNWIKTGAK